MSEMTQKPMRLVVEGRISGNDTNTPTARLSPALRTKLDAAFGNNWCGSRPYQFAPKVQGTGFAAYIRRRLAGEPVEGSVGEPVRFGPEDEPGLTDFLRVCETGRYLSFREEPVPKPLPDLPPRRTGRPPTDAVFSPHTYLSEILNFVRVPADLLGELEDAVGREALSNEFLQQEAGPLAVAKALRNTFVGRVASNTIFDRVYGVKADDRTPSGREYTDDDRRTVEYLLLLLESGLKVSRTDKCGTAEGTVLDRGQQDNKPAAATPMFFMFYIGNTTRVPEAKLTEAVFTPGLKKKVQDGIRSLGVTYDVFDASWVGDSSDNTRLAGALLVQLLEKPEFAANLGKEERLEIELLVRITESGGRVGLKTISTPPKYRNLSPQRVAPVVPRVTCPTEGEL